MNVSEYVPVRIKAQEIYLKLKYNYLQGEMNEVMNISRIGKGTVPITGF